MKFSLKQIRTFIVVFTMLGLIGLACRLPFNLAKDRLPEPTAAVSLEDAQAVEDILQNAQTENGRFAFTLTEEQLTSYLTLKLVEAQDDFDVDNVRVILDNDVVLLTADMVEPTLGVKIPVELLLSASTTLDGELVFTVDSITMGNVDLPERMETNLANAVEKTMNSSLGNSISGFRIDTLYIDEGMITVSGSPR